MKRRFLRFFAASILLLVLALPGAANPLRGRVVGFLDAEKPESSVQMRLETIIILEYPEEKGLVDSLEIEISVPPEIRRYRDSFAFYIYKDLRPSPSADRNSYSGKDILFAVVPSTSKFFISIPLVETASASAGFNTVAADEIVPGKDFPLALTVLPVMKGIPADLYDKDFSIRIKPVFADAGLVNVSVTAEEEGSVFEDPSIIIDGEPVDLPAADIRLDPGIHTLAVSAEGYETFESSFAVQKGTVQTVSAVLKTAQPKVYFEGPDASEVFLDGKPIDYVPGKPVFTDPGDHIVLFQIGEYSLSKKFSVQGGKSYKISLFFDILVKED